MSISCAFITQTRDDLVSVSKILAENLKQSALADPDQPVLWSNHGSYDGGKSLIAEEVASNLGLNIKGNYFELRPYSVTTKGHLVRQFQFHDICYPFAKERGLFSSQSKLQNRQIRKSKTLQNHGGIIFVHNAPKAALNHKADIDISLRSQKKLSDALNSIARSMPRFSMKELDKMGLKRDFDLAQSKGHEKWTRLVKITIHNPDIFDTEFIQRLGFFNEFTTHLRESNDESSQMNVFPS